METFHETRVVSQNILVDLLQSLRNLFGWRLRGYESIISNAAEELISNTEREYSFDSDEAWFRVEVDPMVKGTAIVTIYGQGEPR